MKKQVIFFHGGGSEEDFGADQKLVNSLGHELGPGYEIRYPFLPNNGTPDLGRREQIGQEIAAGEEGVIVTGHSLGASMLLACLSENVIQKKINGIFLISTPFWQGDEDWVKAFQLQPDFAKKLDKNIPLFFYHCKDDEEVPFAHFEIYKKALPWAKFQAIETGGHQLNNDLSVVAGDMKRC